VREAHTVSRLDVTLRCADMARSAAAARARRRV